MELKGNVHDRLSLVTQILKCKRQERWQEILGFLGESRTQTAGREAQIQPIHLSYREQTFHFKSQVKYHEDFEKTKGSFTPVVTDPITERVKKNMQDFSDISYRGIQRRVVEMERKRVDQDQENLTG